MLSRSLIVPAALLISCTFLAIAAQPEHRGHHTPASSVPKQPQPVNDRCPIRGAEVDPETPQRMWKGHAIGFCCPGCDTKWDAKADAEKDAFLARYVKSEPATPALQVAQRFHKARAAGDFASMDRLFLGDDRSTVLLDGTDAGSWERYREQHLKPELKSQADAQWRPLSETQSALGTATLISQSFIVTTGEGAGRRQTAIAVTLVVVDDAGTPKIAHMHWSAR